MIKSEFDLKQEIALLKMQLSDAKSEAKKYRLMVRQHKRKNIACGEAINTLTHLGWTAAKVGEALGLSPTSVSRRIAEARAVAKKRASGKLAGTKGKYAWREKDDT